MHPDQISTMSYSYSGQSNSSPALNSFQISPLQRMMSACVGSIINSFSMTPFDVVRIRLQQQELISPSKSINLPKGCCRTQATVFWLSPVDCSHPCASVAPATARLTGTWQALKFIGLNEGITTLWKGVSLALLIAVPANMVYYAGYDHLKDHIPVLHSAFSPLIAGAIARTVAVVTISPIELIKTRFQAIPSVPGSAGSSKLSNLLNDTSKAVKTNGIGVLFRGLELTLFRDVPFSAIYWVCYESCKKNLMSFFSSSTPQSQDLATLTFLSGSISGTIAAICTNPFDVGKTRLQVSAYEPSSDQENTLVKKSKSRRPPMFKYLSEIVKNEGFGALYVGLIPRVLKIAPSCAVMVSTYEVSKKFFYERDLHSRL